MAEDEIASDTNGLMDMNLSKLWEIVKPGVQQSMGSQIWTRISD